MKFIAQLYFFEIFKRSQLLLVIIAFLGWKVNFDMNIEEWIFWD